MVIVPSGRCVHHVRFHRNAIEQTPEIRKVRAGNMPWPVVPDIRVQ